MNSFIQYLIESAVCLALFYAGYWLFLRKDTFFVLNRIYLVLSALSSLIIPLLNVPSPFRTEPAIVPGPIESAEIAVSFEPSSGQRDWFLIVYGIVAGLLLIRFLGGLFRLLWTVKRNGLKSHQGMRIVHLDSVCSPFSFFNIVFINRSVLRERDFEQVLAHERLHVVQYHSIDNLILELVSILQWFNPFVWPYKKSLRETHEYLADNAVIAQGRSRASYQLLVLEQQVGGRLFEFTNNFKQSHIKRRITMMTKMESKNWARWKTMLIVPIALLLVLAFAAPRLTKATHSDGNDILAADPLGSLDAAGIVSPQEQEKSETQEEEEAQKRQQKEMEEAQKQKLLKIKEEVGLLKDKEKKIREKLEAADDDAEKAELKKYLEEVIKKQGVLKEKYVAIQGGEKDGDEDGEGWAVDAKKKYMANQEMIEKLDKKIEVYKAKLEKVEDEGKRTELEHSLQELMTKQAYLKDLNAKIIEKLKQAKAVEKVSKKEKK